MKITAKKTTKTLLNVAIIVVATASLFALGDLIYVTVRGQNQKSTDVCIKYETITNGGQNTSIGKMQCVLSLEKANTETARAQGLSGRSSMPTSHGMLFVFDSIGRQCIWMKDMHFNLDIAWLNVRGDVVKLEENISPSTYPNEYCADNTFFVIEVASGVAKSAGLIVRSHFNL